MAAAPLSQRFADAVASGDIGVGTALTDADVKRALGYRSGGGVWGGMTNLALSLAEQRQPVRLLEAGGGKWIVALV